MNKANYQVSIKPTRDMQNLNKKKKKKITPNKTKNNLLEKNINYSKDTKITFPITFLPQVLSLSSNQPSSYSVSVFYFISFISHSVCKNLLFFNSIPHSSLMYLFIFQFTRFTFPSHILVPIL